MHWKHKLPNLLSSTWLWMRQTRNLTLWASVTAAALLLVCWLAGYHRLPSQVASSVPEGVEESSFVHAYGLLRPYLRLGALLGSVVCFLHVCTVLPDRRRLVLPATVACAYAALWAVLDELNAHWHAGTIGTMGEPSSPFVYVIKVILLASALLSPPVILLWYSRQTLLDRYTLKNFVQPLVFCLVAFASLWVLIDLIDNLRDFQEAHIGMITVLGLYVSLLPHVFVMAIPAALMLAVLYALTRMSRANEIISMLTAGRSLGQVLRPVFVVSAYASFLAMVANFHWAPRSEGQRTLMMQAANDKKAASVAQVTTMYHHEPTKRTFFVGSMPFDPTRDSISQMEVHQLDEKGRIVTGWYSTKARWWSDGTWFLYNGMRVDYEKGVAVHQEAFTTMPQGGNRISIREWSEKPWTIVSGSLLPDNLGVPDLVSYLSANDLARSDKLASFRTHLMQRFALPWQSLVLVFMAAPLGVSFSRRGALGGIASSVFIFFGLMFLNNLFMNLGKGGRMPSWLAVWMPHLIIGTVGWLVFNMRSENRDFPKLNFAGLKNGLAKLTHLAGGAGSKRKK